MFSSISSLVKLPVTGLLNVSNGCAPLRALLYQLARHRRPFDTMEEARAAAAKIGLGSHEEESNIQLHLKKGESARVSDYPVLFWLQKCLGSARRILDLGGNVGNLFYCYEKYLVFPPDLIWTVYDLPRTVSTGRELAKQRNATKLEFTHQLANLEKYDLLLISGSMHYLEPSLLELLRGAGNRPRWVLINRVPLSQRHEFYTVQKDPHIAVGCRIEKFDSVVSGMNTLGYDLTDHWPVPDRSVSLPLFPSHSIHSYSGLFFTNRVAAPALTN
jgi:putative methyltransferase (TIGR04325 family)